MLLFTNGYVPPPVAEALLQAQAGDSANPRRSTTGCWSGDRRRVALSGTPLYGYVDEEFDKNVLALLASGKGNKLAASRLTI
jgi:hypothetical protein